MNAKENLYLEYLWISTLDGRPGQLQRKVGLLRSQEYLDLKIGERLGIWAYKHAHRLEQRDPNSTSGIWGLSLFRSQRMYGNIPESLHPDDADFEDATDEMKSKAKSFRILCYQRITEP